MDNMDVYCLLNSLEYNIFDGEELIRRMIWFYNFLNNKIREKSKNWDSEIMITTPKKSILYDNNYYNYEFCEYPTWEEYF